MALFGRNKDDEDEEFDEDELLEEERQDRKLTRKFKDLKRENSKKRKEPLKPWGKKERLTVLIIIVSTVLVAGILAISNQAHITFNFGKPSLNLDFSKLDIFKEETITINKR